MCSSATLAEGWSNPINLSDPGQSIAGARSTSNENGDSITLWWDLGENALISTRLSSAGARRDVEVANSRPPSSKADMEIAADSSMSTIVAVYPQTASSGLSLQFVRSDDGGESWSNPVRAAPHLDYVQLLVSHDFQKLIVLGTFGPESSRTLQRVRSLDGGLTWSSPEVLATQSAVWYGISLSAVADERLETVAAFLGYSSRNGQGEPLKSRTLGLISSDSGVSWNPELSLDGWAIRKAKLMPSSGQVVAVGEHVSEVGGASTMALDVLRATGMRGEWLPPINIEGSRYNRHVTNIVSSVDGSILAFAWSSGAGWISDHLVNVLTSIDGGLSWRNYTSVSAHVGTATVSRHSLRMSADGARLALTWVAQTSSQARTELSTASSSDSGLTWATPIVHGEVETIGSSRIPMAELALARSGGFARLVFVHPTALVAAVSDDAGESWSAPDFLSRPVYPADAARLLRISNLELLATWTRSRDIYDRFIEFSRSVDGGITWSKPEVLFDGAVSDIGGTYSASGRNLVVAMWNVRSGSGDKAHVARSLDAGQTWVTDEAVLIPLDSVLRHVQVAAESGRAMIFFTPKFGNARAVRAIVSTDFGVTWSEVPLAALNSRLVDSVISSDGRVVHAAFLADDGSLLGPEIRTSRDGGLSWSISQAVPSSQNRLVSGRFHASHDGIRVNFVSAERDGFFDRFRSRYTVDGGVTWRSGLYNSIQGIDGYGPIVTAGSDDGEVVSVAWKSGSNMVSSVSQNAGASWTFPEVFFPLPTITQPAPNDGAFFKASRDGRRLVLLGIIRNESAPLGSAYMDVVTDFSEDSGLTWAARSVISSNTYISQLALAVSDDASSAVALWKAESGFNFGLRASHVQVVFGRGLNSPIFGSGFEQ